MYDWFNWTFFFIWFGGCSRPGGGGGWETWMMNCAAWNIFYDCWTVAQN